MSYTRKIGLELEYSDVNTYKAVELLYVYFNLDISLWNDSRSMFEKVELDYSHWNAISDMTIKNSDASRTMCTYIQDGVLRRANPSLLEERKKWKGIEIVSSPSSDYRQLLDDTANVSKMLVDNGAKILRRLDNALHVHVDASDLSFDDILLVPQRALAVQESLKKFYTYNGIIVPMYTQKEADLFASCKNVEQLWEAYFRSNRKSSGTVNNAATRRVINISPWLSKPQAHKTIEFRCFSNSNSMDYIKESIDLSLDLFNYLATGTLDFDIEERTSYIESLYY